MKVNVNKKILVKAGVWTKESESEDRFTKYSRYGTEDDKFVIDIVNFTDGELVKLQNAANGLLEFRSLVNKIEVFRKVTKDPEGATMPHLERLEPALKAFLLKKAPNKWLFHEVGDGHVLPYYVEDIEFHPARRSRDGSGSPAYVCLSLHWASHESSHSRNLCYYAADLKEHPTAVQLLEARGYYVENEKMVKDYLAVVERFKDIKNGTGVQFRAVGHAEMRSSDRWGGSSRIAMERDGRSAKVVMDDKKDEYEKDDDDRHSKDSLELNATYWMEYGVKAQMKAQARKSTDVDAEQPTDPVAVPPMHPYVYVFDLSKHSHVEIHVSNLQNYKYDETCGEKLVLPQDKKDLVGILVQGAEFLMEDIVEGKTGGIIVLATGIPGTGKTLTAEIYAEAVKKPLYVVQCSQLGVSADDIEKELTQILSRSSRWGAILLIDEADVYVRERGIDIEQNAIVGVFLRVLEYYRGILFLTSNRATSIDDAVLSRATAHIVYEAPSPAEAAKIWKVLSEQFKLKLKGEFAAYGKAFPGVTGRTIKNLLKLAMLISQREKKPITLELVKYASQFLDGVNGKAE